MRDARLVKFLRTVSLAFLSLGLMCVCAEGQSKASATPTSPQQSQPSQSQPAPASEPQLQQAPPNRGVGQQLVHETNEAAGEEKDETEQFKQSASVQFVAKYLTGGNLRSAYWLCVALNFAVVAGLIVWAAKKALPGMMRARTAAIQKAMQEAQQASAQARGKLAEIESRLAKLGDEISAIRDAAEKEAASEEARIQAAAKEEAGKIVAAAEQEIAAAAKSARRSLTAHAADLAVGLAQKQIRVDAATDQALIRSFSSDLTDPRKDGN